MAELGGALERAVMESLWAASRPLRVRELLVRLNEGSDRRLAYNTVQTVAERLTRKGLVRRVAGGQAFQYEPTRSREDYTAALMLDALTDSDDRASILARLAEGLDPADARQLLDALRERTRGGPRGLL